MTVSFVSTSDNKYVQYRLMSDSFNTTPANWQGVDDEPTALSENLVKSGGVYNTFNNKFDNITKKDIDVTDTGSEIIILDDNDKEVVNMKTAGDSVDEEQCWCDNTGTDIYAKINKNGIYAKAYKDLNGHDITTGQKYKGWEIFSIWDSLGQLGIWQEKLSELCGANFDKALNSSLLSIGGRYLLDYNYSEHCGQYAIKYLVENYNSRAQKGLIFLENVHDRPPVGSLNDIPYFITTAYTLPDTYATAQDAYDALFVAANRAQFTPIPCACIKAYFTTIKTTLVLTTLPSVGNFYVVEKKNGTEVGRYGVNVNAEDTLSDVLGHIAEYEYQNLVARVVQNTVVFTHYSNDIITLELIENGTGIAGTFTDSRASGNEAISFVSKNINEWNDDTKWVYTANVSLYSKLKGILEYLQENLPYAKVFLVMPTYSNLQNATARPEWYYPDGSFNVAAWKNFVSSSYDVGNKLYQDCINAYKEIGELYGIECIDLMNNVGISPINWLSYYTYDNSHPIMVNGKYPAYEKWAEYINKNL